VVVLVTGARGFLGRYVCERLRLETHDVVAAGRPEVEIPSAAFDDLLAARSIGAVVHCATPASVLGSIERPHEDRTASVAVLERVLAGLSALARPPRLVFVSSAAVYGEPRWLPVTEDEPTEPLSPYGRHRLECENLVAEYAETVRVPAVNLRVFSAYGEGLRRQVLWEICRQALTGGQVELAGTGDETRDFVHAHDVAGAVAIALGGEARGAVSLNVAGGRATSIRALAEALAHELGVGEQRGRFTRATRPGDPRHWQADVSRIRALGWAPRVSLAAGLAAYAAWARTASYAESSWSR
jgi:UDP-glucose 4-epimerase